MNEIKNYGYLDNLELYEYIAFPIYIIIILLISMYIQNKNIRKNPFYKYYTLGVSAKIAGAVVFCLVYIFYYKGGDTIAYFESSRALSNLFYDNPRALFQVIFSSPSKENFYLFNGHTGYPWGYMYFDPKTYMVLRIVFPFLLISFNSYVLSTILLSYFSFFGLWKVYLMFCRYYSEIAGRMAIAVLFIPSVIFWGSGIMKDTITLSCSAWFIYLFHQYFIAKERKFLYLVFLFVMAYVVLNIKPYIMISLLPGAVIWVLHERIISIKSKFLRYMTVPMIYLIGLGLGYAVLTFAGGFDLNASISDAIEKQSDLKQSYYGGSSFDIGDIDPSFSGMVKMAPAAIIAGLYRPFIYEARNVVVLLAGLENLLYMYLTMMIFYHLKIRKFLKVIFETPIILFCLSYATIFSLIVGFSTSNFGALVRFKIPYLPFLLASLFVMDYLAKKRIVK